MLSVKGCFKKNSFYESLAFSVFSIMQKNYYPYLNMPLSLVGAISELHLGHVVFFDSFKSKAILELRLFSVVKNTSYKVHTHAKNKNTAK